MKTKVLENFQPLHFFIVMLGLFATLLLPTGISSQEKDLEALYVQAQSNSALRAIFVDSYVQYEGLPEHLLQIQYSEEIKTLALTHPLVKNEAGDYRPTSHALAIGRGYPSSMTFGPKMFHPAYRYPDFLSVIQHEAAHAKFWAIGKLNYLDGVDTGKNSKVRLRGLIPILFELDALKTQMEHHTWQQTSAPFRNGQEGYRQKWLDKLEGLGKQSYMYDMKPLLDRIQRTYEKP